MNLSTLNGIAASLHFDFTQEPKPTRKGYGDQLVSLGKKHEEIMVLCADLTDSTTVNRFRDAFPKRFVQIGVAEQNLVTVAAGLAHLGKMPFISSYAMFCPGRCWEQIRTTVCYNDENVKVIGAHSGISVGPDGATHQALEDIGIMRTLPNMTVVVPCDYHQTAKATTAITEHKGPCYMRFARAPTPQFTTEDTPFELGKVQVFKEGTDVALIGSGPVVYECLVAAYKLQDEGINAMVVNCHTVKPMDIQGIVGIAKKVKAIVSVEEHQVHGGMGSAISEVLCQHHPVPMHFVGVDDRFGESGDPEELLKEFGFCRDDIVSAAKEVMKRKA
ncbi:MAG: transketolase family protein [Nanoarchaeota archaeon]